MHCLSYHQSEKLIAIGWSTGLVEIRRADERDGSAAGKEIILSYGGRNSLRIRETQGAGNSEAGYAKSSRSYPVHIDDDLLVFVNSHGTVVTLHDDTFAGIRDEDGGTDEDEDDEDDQEYEDSEELNESRTKWKIRQIDGFALLSIEGNYEGDFI